MTTTINASTSSGLVQTADTSGILQLQTASTAALTIDASQNVGIGTSSPSSKLNVYSSTTNGGRLRITGTASTAGNYRGLELGNASGFSGGIFQDENANGLIFWPVGTGETMRIDSSGNVLVGTTSSYNPISNTQVSISASNTAMLVMGVTSIAVGNETSRIVMGGSLANNRYNSISTFCPAGAAGTDILDMRFSTINGGSSGPTERMRLTPEGNLLVGTTAPTSGVTTSQVYVKRIGTQTTITADQTGGTGGYNYTSNATSNGGTYYHFNFLEATTSRGSITSNGTVTIYATTSDYRLKENVKPMVGALATVAKLNPVTYDWSESKVNGQGFIAHELQSIIPDAVVGKKDAIDEVGNPVYQQIDTSILVATLTSAIQEQQALIENLTTRLAALEGAK